MNLQGKSQVSQGTLIQTITSYLSRSQATSTLVKGTKPFKTQETKNLIAFINQNKLWYCNINFDAIVPQAADEVIDNKTIAIISIANKATASVFITNPEKNNQQEFYVRRNASAIALTMYEMFNYSKDHWG